MKLNGISPLANGPVLNGNSPAEASPSIPTDAEKVELLTQKFEQILGILGMNLEDDSLRDTPARIAKMYIHEIFRGMNPRNRPKITLFKNTYQYHSPVMEMNIPFTSFCEHHFVPIIGRANIAYIPDTKVIGLSKLHRLVDFYARRPQVQERFISHLFSDLLTTLETEDLGVVLQAQHSCISCRGVNDQGSFTITSQFSGKLADNEGIKLRLMEYK